MEGVQLLLLADLSAFFLEVFDCLCLFLSAGEGLYRGCCIRAAGVLKLGVFVGL